MTISNNIIPEKYKSYKIKKIESDASKRFFYRLSNKNESVVLMDSRNEKEEYLNYINVHAYLSQINISIPIIKEKNDKNYILVLEDLGDLRFDKILSKYELKVLLEIAIKALINIKNNISFNDKYKLTIYNFDMLVKEISEFPNYYYPFVNKKKIPDVLKNEFYQYWDNWYNSIDFDFSNFVHKDFNMNNLLYLPHRKDYLKCGIIDFQNAFWGESCWDLFSLLEDSRFYFNNQYNQYLINLYFDNTKHKSSKDQFLEKYNMLNCSRQTRLLGRWIKLSEKLGDKRYLKFINVTKKRLCDCIKNIENKKFQLLYNRLIPGILDD